MNKYLIFLSFLFILFFACNRQKDQPVILKDKMITMITEISLAEAYAETYVLKDSALNKDSVLQQELKAVYQTNNVTPQAFAKSYQFYSSNPILFKEIIDSAHARAYRNKDRIYLSTSAN
ncbi:MAG: DUF4296 domain-containing protein [Bacteroidota bacterium]|jgi:hypothetical protein